MAHRRKRLFNSLAALLALASPLATFAASTTWTVDSCSDANTGSGTTGTLRYAAAHAMSQDKIDMSGLTCSTITLATSDIPLSQQDLTISGPGVDKLTITTTGHNRIFTHTGTGTLEVYDLTVSDGYVVNLAYQGYAIGGCIYSNGPLTLIHSAVRGCSVHIDVGEGEGGGIYTKGDVTLKYSTIADNVATGTNYATWGGGIYTHGQLNAKYSTISGNVATTVNFKEGYGGGMRVGGNLTMLSCTVVGNYAGGGGGGIESYNRFNYTGLTTTITNSTITGNSSGGYVGGLYSNLNYVNVSNSTIVFNHAAYDNADIASGMFVQNFNGTPIIKLTSTLIAGNSDGFGAHDFSIRTHGTLSGDHNLVRTSNVAMPDDTLTGCPQLGGLRDNGGPTLTHALLSGSPAIDAGSLAFAFHEDQRGIYADKAPYSYPRTSGIQPDIGAYEVNQDDIVFNTSFDGCG